jgi:hypothetical protein
VSAIWHDQNLPSFLGIPPSFSFYDQAQVEQPAPISYQVAQRFRESAQFPLGPNFRQEIARRAREVWGVKRPWWLGVC